MLGRVAGLLFLLTGMSPGFAQSIQEDPYESYNRHMFRFNQTLDKIFFKPVAKIYKTLVPWPITHGINNFFMNLEQIPTVLNDLLQGDLHHAVTDTCRFVINTTLGIGGFIDVASKANLPMRSQDFGLTLAKWGYKSSSYLVLPILGPRTVRDAVSWPINYGILSVYPYVHDLGWRNGLHASNYWILSKPLKQVSFDDYTFQRNAYLQRRNYLIVQNEKKNQLNAQDVLDDDLDGDVDEDLDEDLEKDLDKNLDIDAKNSLADKPNPDLNKKKIANQAKHVS
ncbi:MlaA family lipoprotein [Rickettsiella massiliensis]|uniref:MlaA family lipoprotein n=1 Tax=Rickettsiella massiliensis TaxID=676517 RepID=UPI00029A1DCC|nr:VacJ family lipoprotein [Rickettsiella massiliensis]